MFYVHEYGKGLFINIFIFNKRNHLFIRLLHLTLTHATVCKMSFVNYKENVFMVIIRK